MMSNVHFFYFKLDLSAVFFYALLLSVFMHVAAQHTTGFRNKYTYAIAFTSNDNLQFIFLNLVQFSKLLAYFNLFIIPVSATAAGLVSLRFSSSHRSFAKTPDITD